MFKIIKKIINDNSSIKENGSGNERQSLNYVLNKYINDLDELKQRLSNEELNYYEINIVPFSKGDAINWAKAIWRSIYSTNLIESFNKQLKKYSKRKEQFPNEPSIERFLVSQFEPYKKFSTRCHLGFDQARAELMEMFDQIEA